MNIKKISLGEVEDQLDGNEKVTFLGPRQYEGAMGSSLGRIDVSAELQRTISARTLYAIQEIGERVRLIFSWHPPEITIEKMMDAWMQHVQGGNNAHLYGALTRGNERGKFELCSQKTCNEQQVPGTCLRILSEILPETDGCNLMDQTTVRGQMAQEWYALQGKNDSVEEMEIAADQLQKDYDLRVSIDAKLSKLSLASEYIRSQRYVAQTLLRSPITTLHAPFIVEVVSTALNAKLNNVPFLEDSFTSTQEEGESPHIIVQVGKATSSQGAIIAGGLAKETRNHGASFSAEVPELH